MSKREEAMNWWNELSHLDKGMYMEGEFKYRHPQSLTGREIEIFFENKNCPHCNSDRIKRCPPDMSDWCLNCSAVIRKNHD